MCLKSSTTLFSVIFVYIKSLNLVMPLTSLRWRRLFSFIITVVNVSYIWLISIFIELQSDMGNGTWEMGSLAFMRSCNIFYAYLGARSLNNLHARCVVSALETEKRTIKRSHINLIYGSQHI